MITLLLSWRLGAQVVELDGEVLEKPADAAQARDMLRRLSNNSHIVHTGAP